MAAPLGHRETGVGKTTDMTSNSMVSEDWIFEAEPDDLRRLVRSGMEMNDTGAEGDRSGRASIDGLLERAGARIDRYRLLRVLGGGGMGIVYLAEQSQPIRRQVALKVIKPGMDSAQVIGRFEAERQALALLDHPHVAQVYDAGTTGTGRPYFVMEYVQGLPITEYCDKHGLTIEQRLTLFQQVCEAVQHAHEKGIIHRDLKPSNILVATDGDKAKAKIIDFGVAKAIGQPLTEQMLLTEDSRLLGTPEYMSPEQADMASQDIDTRSDVYSLGAVLYELLTGVLPFDRATLRSGGIEHIRQVIREEEPETPSTRLTSLGEQAARIAERRGAEVGTLARRLHRELEWIPLKAMRKERARRYRSASELADDIQNYLRGAPLIAGPESAVYRLKKSVRRHQHFVAAAAIVIASLVLGFIVSTVLYFRATGLRVEAEQAQRKQAAARAEAEAVSSFLRNSVLASLDPYRVGGREITIRSVLDSASQDIEGKLKGTPLAEAEIRYTLGSAYWSLGLYDQAERHLSTALDIQQDRLGIEDPNTLESIHRLGWLRFSQSRYTEAELLLTQAREVRRRVLGEEHRYTMESAVALACVYYMQGRFQEAEEVINKALETARRVLGREDPYVPPIMNALACVYELQGRYEDAERLARQGLDIGRGVLGENDWFLLLLKHTVGRTNGDLGCYDEAEGPLWEALNGRRDIWGQEHPDTLATMADLGWLYHSQGHYEKAESLFDEVLKTARRILGEAHITTTNGLHGLGTVYLSQERHDEAQPLLEKALEIVRRLLGEGNWATLEATNTLAKLCRAQGRYDKAERLFKEALEGRREELGDDHPETLVTINDLGVLRREQGQCEEAESLLLQALEGRQRKLGPNHPACFESMHELAVLYIVQGRYEDAEPLLLEAFHGREAKLGPEHPHTIESLRELVTLYESWNKAAEAAKWRSKLPRANDAEQ